MISPTQADRPSSLVCRVANLLFALPIEHVQETMRPLPVEPIARVPAFVRGLAIIRGAPLPVIDAGLLVGGAVAHPSRFVTVTTGNRRVALAVDAVVGIKAIPPESLQVLPPLFQETDHDLFEAVGTIDAELMLVLRSTRLISAETWAAIDADTAPASA